MPFSSLLFLLYFIPIVLTVNFILKFSVKAQNVWLLLANFVFFGWGGLPYAYILFFMILSNYLLGIKIYEAKEKEQDPKWMFIVACIVNLGPLFVYRYLGSLIGTVAFWAKATVQPLNIIAPLGISVIALQSISYVIDIYKERVPLEKNFINCGLYLSFFPLLFAGPLVRYNQVADKIRIRETNFDNLTKGFYRLFTGIVKIVIVGQPLAIVADTVFNLSSGSGTITNVPVLMALLGTVAFILQIYHQLTGFSHVAIGLGQVFGFTYPENFNNPILATSMKDFWQRTYISLTDWFSVYVKDPLYKEGKGLDHLVRNNFIMWLCIGIWLGPGIPNLIFAFVIFVCLTFEQTFELEDSNVPMWGRRIYVLFIMFICMIAFRTSSIYELSLFMSNILGISHNGLINGTTVMLFREYWIFLVIGLILLFPVVPFIRDKFAVGNKVAKSIQAVFLPIITVILLFVVFVFVTNSGYSPDLFVEYNMWSLVNG